MKNKGFTIVEMLSAFILSSIIIIILFQLIINLKEVYQASGSKTDMLNKKSIMIDKIYTDLNEKKLVDFSICGTNCVNLIYSTGETKQIIEDVENKTISYDSYTMKITNNFNIEDMFVETSGNTYAYNSEALLNIKIPIASNTNEDYSINIVYPYTSNDVKNHTTYVQNSLIAYLDAEHNTGIESHSENTTTWVDLSGNGNDATLYNNPTWGTNSITFDGETNYATIGNMVERAFPNGVSLETRVKIKSSKGALSSGTIEFINNYQGSGFGILFYAGTTFSSQLHTNNTWYTAQNTVTSSMNTYYTVALTYDNNLLKTYVNGSLVKTTEINGNTPVTPSTTPFCVGCNPNTTGAGSYSNVEVQNVLIYDRALTSDEILQNYQADQIRY